MRGAIQNFTQLRFTDSDFSDHDINSSISIYHVVKFFPFVWPLCSVFPQLHDPLEGKEELNRRVNKSGFYWIAIHRL